MQKIIKFKINNMGMENPFGQAPASLKEATKEAREKALAEIIADPANIESLDQFIGQLQALVEERETKDRTFNLSLALEMNKTLAEFYAEAANQNPIYAEMAGDSYYDAARLALQAGDEQLYQELLKKHRKY